MLGTMGAGASGVVRRGFAQDGTAGPVRRRLTLFKLQLVTVAGEFQ